MFGLSSLFSMRTSEVSYIVGDTYISVHYFVLVGYDFKLM